MIRNMYCFIKRILDIIIASWAILILSAPALIVCIMIKTTSKGPVLHKSYRLGKNRKPFLMYKFRTMEVNAPVMPLENFENADTLFIPYGKIFRVLGIDELPQLYNILKGDMSLVGPRPILSNEHEFLRLRLGGENKIYSVSPGLTGLAQINGRNRLDFPTRVRLDQWYSDHISLKTDAQIFFRTVPTIIKEYSGCLPVQNQVLLRYLKKN